MAARDQRHLRVDLRRSLVDNARYSQLSADARLALEFIVHGPRSETLASGASCCSLGEVATRLALSPDRAEAVVAELVAANFVGSDLGPVRDDELGDADG